MFVTDSKIVCISGQYVLEESGNLWEIKEDEWHRIACCKPPEKKKRSPKDESEFNIFWEAWKGNVKCASPRQHALKAFNNLSQKDIDTLLISVPLYAKTQPQEKHEFLKRAPAYINSGLFREYASFKETTEIALPSWSDPVWQKEIVYNGIQETAHLQVNRFGMDKAEAYKKAKEAE